MVDFSSFLATPQGYSTQDQLDKAQDFAYALMKSHPDAKEHFSHWAQGVDEVTRALAGRARLNDIIGRTNTLRDKEAKTSADIVYGTDPNVTTNASPEATASPTLGQQLWNGIKGIFTDSGEKPQGWDNATVSTNKVASDDDLYHAAFDNTIA